MYKQKRSKGRGCPILARTRKRRELSCFDHILNALDNDENDAEIKVK